MTGMGLRRVRAAAVFAAMTTVTITMAMMAAPARAYTPEQEQACTSDAFRLCSSEIPDVDRVTACMVRNRSQLSPPCRAQFRPDPPRETLVEERSERPMSIHGRQKKPAKGKSASKSHKTAKSKS